MIPDRIGEYVRMIDGGSLPSVSTNWTLTSPNLTVWSPSITTAGVVSFTDGAVAGDSVILVGLDGLAWTPTIDNSGIVSVASGTELTSAQTAASLVDSGSVQWYFYVDLDGLVTISTVFAYPSLFRYPSVTVRWTPASASDTFILYSLRASITVRRKTS